MPETQSQGLLFFVAEVQVRTVMQHAFAEIERDIRYKSKSAIPLAISRRFMTLAGLLEIADREFQAIQEEDATLRAAGRTLIDEGRLDEVEVTADALHIYLDARLGADDRISDFTYEWMAKDTVRNWIPEPRASERLRFRS